MRHVRGQGGNMTKKRILIYGDSNTYGFDGATRERFDENTRWTKVCQKLLGDDYEIIEEGLCGRTTCHDMAPEDMIETELMEAPFVNGLKYIGPCVLSHLPLDVICVKLGSNDLDVEGTRSPEMIAESAAKVLRKAKALAEEKMPDHPCKYVLMAPMISNGYALTGEFADSFTKEILERAKLLPAEYEKKAAEEGFLYFNANEQVQCGKADGTHLDAENHGKMAKAVSQWFKENI